MIQKSSRRPFARRLPLGLCALALAACRPAAQAQIDAAPPIASVSVADYEAWTASFFIEYFGHFPVTATSLGDHSHDDAWPDLSAQGRAAQMKWAQAQLARADELEGAALSVDQRSDLQIVRDQLGALILAETQERVWSTNPLAWSYLMGGGLDTLISRDFAPVDTRAEALAARLEGLPALLATAAATMADAAAIKAPQAAVAKQQLEGMRALIRSEIPKKMAAASAPLRDRIGAAGRTALSALDAYEAAVLSDARLAQAKGEWRLGKALFTKKLGYTLGEQVDADALYARATKAQREVLARMEGLAFELYEPLFGKRAPASADELGRAAIVRQVLTELAKIHPSPESLRDACEANLTTITEFVNANNIVTLDPKERLEVIWTPPHQQGVAIAGLDPAPPLDEGAKLQSFYLVQPLPSTWDAAVRESFLREYNHFMLEILSIHEAIPGHFVQLYYSARDPSKIRRAFGNGPFIEGWAVYTESVMVNAGYAGVDPTVGNKRPADVSERLWAVAADPTLRSKAIALHGAKFYLRTVTNAVLDYEIHVGKLDETGAMEMMVGRAYQQQGEARGKWIRAQVTSTQLSTYFVGASRWFELRAAAEAQPGFDAGAWHAEAISHGAPPLAALERIMQAASTTD